MKKPVARKAATRELVSLHNMNTIGPEELELEDQMRNEKEIAAWWGRVKLYAKAMHELDRVVMLHHIADENRWYLSSIPECVSAPATEEARDA